LLAWLNYCDTQGVLPAALCAASLHELGHLAAIRAAGGRVKRLRLSAVGAELRLDGTLGYGAELLCALAGPAVNLLLAFVAARIGATMFAGMSLVLGLFNLLPIGTLDGGRILRCLTGLLFGPMYTGLLGYVDGVVIAGLLICGSVVLGMGGSITLVLVAAWLALAFVRKTQY